MHDQTARFESPAHPSQFKLWTDIVGLCRRLKLSAQVINDGHDGRIAFLDGLASGWNPVAPHAFSQVDESALRAAVAQAVETIEPQVVETGHAVVGISPLVGSDRRAVGVVLVAGHDSGGAGGFGPPELVTIASWFAKAIAARPSEAFDEAVEVRRLGSLLQILDDASASSSEREIMRAFVDVLAVWNDAEPLAYAGDLAGRFELAVLLPGSDRARAPSDLGRAVIPNGAAVSQLSSDEAQRAGFSGTAVTLVRIRPRAASDWAIALPGLADSAEQDRVAVYAIAVAQALTTLTAVAVSRLTWAVFQHLWPAAEDGPVQEAVERAMSELGLSLAGSACVIVTHGDARAVFGLGDAAESASSGGSPDGAEAMTIPVEVPSPDAAVIRIARKSSLTRRDQELACCVSSMLGAWLNAVVGRLIAPPVVRADERSLDGGADEGGEETLVSERWTPTIVVSLASNPSSARACIAEIRRHLRPGDRANRLRSGDIGILLQDPAGGGGHVVAGRLRQLIQSGRGLAMLPITSVGVTETPGQLVP